MKTLNKIVSLVMVVIMLITATPVLQAADFVANLDKQELNDFRKEINSVITKGFDEVPLFEGIPDLKTLKQRYDTAKANYKENLKTFSKQQTKQSNKDYERYIEFLKKEAQKRIQTDSKYDGFISETEKEQVAFYTVLLEEIEKSKEERQTYYGNIVGDTCTSLMVAIIVGYMAYEMNATVTGILVSGGVGGTIAMLLMFLLIAPAKQAVFNYSLFSDELMSKFLNNPFFNLALFNQRGVNDFGSFYIKSEKCARLLYDTVDIEYYISRNPSIENMQARLYTQARDWHDLTTEQRIDYIHNLAERLRAEAK